jgi:dynein heavy chain
MRDAMLDNKVPGVWKELSYTSQKPLSSWIIDLNDRVEFMRDWATKGHPITFWLAGFFFPNGFMTATLQTHSRDHTLPIDKLKYCFNVLEEMEPEELDGEYPENGVYIHSLYI